MRKGMGTKQGHVHKFALVFSGAVIFLLSLPGNRAGSSQLSKDAGRINLALRAYPLHCLEGQEIPKLHLRGGGPKKKPKAAAAAKVKSQNVKEAAGTPQAMQAGGSNEGQPKPYEPAVESCPKTGALDKDETDSLYSSDLPTQVLDVGKSQDSWLKRAQVPYGFYNILGLDKSAGEKEIRQAYRKLAILAHPDRNPHNVEDATAKFQILQKAYEVLSDSTQKSLYDISGLLEDDATEFGMGMGDMEFKDVVDYFRQLERVVSQEDIISFENEYRGKLPEKSDLVAFYHRFKGDLADVVSYIPYAEDDDIDRFRAILTQEIQSNNLPAYKAFNSWKLDIEKTPDIMVPKKRVLTQSNHENFEALKAKIQENRSKRAKEMVERLQKYAPESGRSTPSLQAPGDSTRPKRQATMSRQQSAAPVVRAVAQKSTARLQKAPKPKAEAAGKTGGKRGRPPTAKAAEGTSDPPRKTLKKKAVKSNGKAASTKKKASDAPPKGVEKVKTSSGNAAEKTKGKAKEPPGPVTKAPKSKTPAEAVKRAGTKKTAKAEDNAPANAAETEKPKKTSKDTKTKAKTGSKEAKTAKKKKGRPPKVDTKTTSQSMPAEKKPAKKVTDSKSAKVDPPASKAAKAATGKKSEIIHAGTAAMRARVLSAGKKDRVVAKASSAARKQPAKKVAPIGASTGVSGVRKPSRNPRRKSTARRPARGRTSNPRAKAAG